jgi:hypothetical protein
VLSSGHNDNKEKAVSDNVEQIELDQYLDRLMIICRKHDALPREDFEAREAIREQAQRISRKASIISEKLEGMFIAFRIDEEYGDLVIMKGNASLDTMEGWLAKEALKEREKAVGVSKEPVFKVISGGLSDNNIDK